MTQAAGLGLGLFFPESGSLAIPMVNNMKGKAMSVEILKLPLFILASFESCPTASRGECQRLKLPLFILASFEWSSTRDGYEISS
jgi:hypothetical protein